MKQPEVKTVKVVSVAGGTSGAVVAAFAAGWIEVGVLIIAIVVPIAALCCVLADEDRPDRLARLISTWRHGAPARRRRELGNGHSGRSAAGIEFAGVPGHDRTLLDLARRARAVTTDGLGARFAAARGPRA